MEVLDDWKCETDIDRREYINDGEIYTCTLQCYFKEATEEACNAKLSYDYTYDILVVIAILLFLTTFDLYLLNRAINNE